MTRLALVLALALAPTAALAQDAEDDGVTNCADPGSCVGSSEDETACYVVAGIAAAAFGGAAIAGLIVEGNPCAYLRWGGGTCGECNDAAPAAAARESRRGVGVGGAAARPPSRLATDALMPAPPRR